MMQGKDDAPRPCHDTIQRHLQILHGGAGQPWDARIALACGDGSGAPTIGRTFDLANLDEAAAWGAERNAAPGAPLYGCPALFVPDAPPRPSDSHFRCTWWGWVDIDAQEAVGLAGQRWADAPPTLVCVTGKVPHTRIQLLWRFTLPVTDPEWLRALLRGAARHFDGDPAVTNPGRLLRVMGSVAWPHKSGRVAEVTYISGHKSSLDREYDPETLEHVFGLVHEPSGYVNGVHPPPPRGPFQTTADGSSIVRDYATGRVVDGRHEATVRLVARHLRTFVGDHGAWPDAEELFAACRQEYEDTIDLTRPGRAGLDYLRRQCAYTARRAEEGRFGALEEVVVRDHEWRVERGAEDLGERVRTSQGGRFRLVPAPEFDSIEPPEFLVDDWILRQGITLLWGAPGIKKSFILLDIALCVAGGWEWNGCEIDAPGDVIYFAAEGALGIAGQRAKAWSKHHRRELPGGFWLAGEAFRFPKDAGDMVRDIEAAGIAPRMICIDTLSKTITGTENEDDTVRAYTQGAEDLARHFNCQVVVVHHSGKDTDRGPRGSSTLHGDWDVSIAVKAKGDSLVTVEHHKAKDFEEISTDFSWVTVPLGEAVTMRSDGTEKRRPISSLVMVPVEGGERTAAEARQERAEKPKLGKNEARVLGALRHCRKEGVGFTALQAMLSDMNRGSLSRALRALADKGEITVSGAEGARSYAINVGCI